MAKRKRRNIPEKHQKRHCPVEKAGVTEINYKDIELLKLFITTKGKIIPRRISGLSSKTQTKVTAAIKQARNACLLSFAQGYVPQEEEQEKPRFQGRK
ncbi:MAG: 30S ribosomal protein S18 [SAR324 cluster bacterium]|nr:30S ribosomal protein S18 [SAR324 cluster bacterium]